MERSETIETLLADPEALCARAAGLSDADAAALVDRLKAEADRHWFINANRSLELAALIIHVGQARGDLRQTALGSMTYGDALRYLGQLEAGWEKLDEAGALFLAGGDEVGWARTRIGRVAICVDLNRVAEALADAERARDILVRHGVGEKVLALDLNCGYVHYLLGDQRRALELYQSALDLAERLGTRGRGLLGVLYTNIGIVYDLLGDFRQALAYHERARAVFVERDETSGLAIAEQNIAHIAMAQGRYRHALQLLHEALGRCLAAGLDADATHIRLDIIQCYMQLNRPAEMRELAQQVIAEYRASGAAFAEGRALLYLAMAEAGLDNLAAAQEALDLAEPIFRALGADMLVATTHLRRGQIALRQGDAETARLEATAAAAGFVSDGQQVNYAQAMLLRGQALLAVGRLADAEEAGRDALAIARGSNVPHLRYGAHLLLGRVAEAQGRVAHAARRFAAAVATVERVQQGLTITMRPGFLEDKGEALRALIGLRLRCGDASRALEALERAKSLSLLGYLANRERLRWASDDAQSQELIAELERLREEHQWFYRLAHDRAPNDDGQLPAVPYEQALAEVAAREKRMRAISEQLYLRGGDQTRRPAPPRLRDLQAALDDGALLIEFYNDGASLWAFALDQRGVAVQRAPALAAAIDELIARLQRNVTLALGCGPDGAAAGALARAGRQLLGRLYAALLAPLAAHLEGRRRLVVVPYGTLHYLPFHLLHDGEAYLIERCEVVVLPAAGLLTRKTPARAGGVRALAHSWEGRLPQTHAEALLATELFGGRIYCEAAARRSALQAEPTTILHIAAHGEQRFDQPDLSYIQLDDGQLYTDDLLQQDMSYELVVLSACETGRADVAAGDELIGLGRGFLYAGAGALIASLWRVADTMAYELMARVYAELSRGASKAAALRAAQLAILARWPDLHPAFWGAFQLVGDARPLSLTILRPEPAELLAAEVAA